MVVTKRYTKQQTFDLVAFHLLKQSRKSTTLLWGKAGCAYRGDKGLCCAAGCLIPDALYRESFECKIVTMLPMVRSCRGVSFRGLFGHDKELVRILQQIHDRYVVDRWMLGLFQVCEDHRLGSDTVELFRIIRRDGKFVRYRLRDSAIQRGKQLQRQLEEIRHGR